MTFQLGCLAIVFTGYAGAALGYALDGQYALACLTALYAMSCVPIMLEGAK